MARYRKVDPRIWNDAKFCDLSDNAKLVFFMLLTHPSMTALGAMRASLAGLAEELGWEHETFRAAFHEVRAKGMVEHDPKACLVALPKFVKYNPPESPNVIRAWVGAADLLPECELKSTVMQRMKEFANGYGKAFGKAFGEASGKASPKPSGKASPKTSPNQEQEQEQEQEQDKPPLPPLPGGTPADQTAAGVDLGPGEPDPPPGDTTPPPGDTVPPPGDPKPGKKPRRRKNVTDFDPLADLPFSSPAFVEAWASWVRHRNDLRKPLTFDAKRLQCQKLSGMGEARAIAAIEHSILRNWLSIFEERDPPQGNGFHARTQFKTKREKDEEYMKSQIDSLFE